MWYQLLVEKALEDSQWRRDTALGRKVASKISVEDCDDIGRENLRYKEEICPLAEIESDMNYELLEEMYF